MPATQERRYQRARVGMWIWRLACIPWTGAYVIATIYGWDALTAKWHAGEFLDILTYVGLLVFGDVSFLTWAATDQAEAEAARP